jgi:hypothetical protein
LNCPRGWRGDSKRRKWKWKCDVRRRGNKEVDYDDETSWPDLDYIDLYNIVITTGVV